jgi:hypothetical protein
MLSHALHCKRGWGGLVSVADDGDVVTRWGPGPARSTALARRGVGLDELGALELGRRYDESGDEEMGVPHSEQMPVVLDVRE